MNKLDRIVEKAVKEWVSKEATIDLHGVAEKSAKAVAKEVIVKADRLLKKCFDLLEYLLLQNVNQEVKWRSWLKKKKKEWENIKRQYGVEK